MPLIQVKLIQGVFSASEKQAMIEMLTDAMVSIEGEALRGATTVTIDEVASGDWGIGGRALKTTDVLAMRGTAPTVRELRCRDAGFDCDAVVRGQTDDEIFALAGPHAREVHGVEVTSGLREQLTGLVHNVPVGPGGAG